jgi:hypothetical protein
MYIHTYTWTYVDLFRSFQFVCFRLIAVAWILWLSLPLKQNKHMPVHAITVVITVSCSWSIWAQDEQPWWCWWGGNCYILLHIAKLRIATVSVHGSKCVLLKYHGISHLPTVQQRCHRYMAPPVRWPRVNTWISWKISKSPVEFFKWPIRTMYRKPLYWMGRENYIYVFLMFPDVSVDFPNQPIRWLVSLVTMQRGTPSDWMETTPLNLRHQLSPTCSGLKSWMRFMTSRSMSMSCQTKAVRNGEIRET